VLSCLLLLLLGLECHPEWMPDGLLLRDCFQVQWLFVGVTGDGMTKTVNESSN